MRIKVKDKNAQSKIPGILFITFFGISSSGIIIGSSEKFKGNYKLDSISQIFNDLGIVSLFASIFLCVSLFLLLYLLKTPKKCAATVLSTSNNEEDSTKDLELLIKDGAKEFYCECQIAITNDIDATKKYIAAVKEFNGEVKYLEEFNEEEFFNFLLRSKKIKIIGAVLTLFIIIRIIVFGG